MAPKRHVSKAAPTKARQSPILSMLVDSPDRGQPSRPLAKSKSALTPFNLQQHAFGSAAVKASNGLRRMMNKQSPPSVPQGKARDQGKETNLLWCDFYAPRQRSELGIHKKKIEQVEAWLKEALNGRSAIKRYRRILILSGPSGSGKSTLVRALSNSDELNFEIVDWNSNDVQGGIDAEFYWDRGRSNEQVYDDSERPSTSTKLSSFLSNASRYSQLRMQLEEEEDSTKQAPQSIPPVAVSSRRIILLEDLPNLSHLPTRDSFHATLEAFLQQSGNGSIPLIIIVSESVPRLDEWGAESSSRDYKERNESTMTVRNLIPSAIRGNVGFMNIEFNAVAPTILTKALKRVIDLARPSYPELIPAPSSATAREIFAIVTESAEGDLRNAVNTLQVVCLNGGSDLAGNRGIKRKANGKADGKVSKRFVAAVSGKETSLVLFHALGKILYNKRVGDPDDEGDTDDERDQTQEIGVDEREILPVHWQSLFRRKSRVDSEMLWRSMPVDASTLQAFLHQNYTPFCDDIEQCAALCDNISIADSVKPAHEEWTHTTLTDYYNFLITIHGSLLSLPSPVSRNQVRKMKGVALFHKMKELRENYERLNEYRVAIRQEVQEGEAPLSTLSDASSTSLITELLPLLSKSHPNLVTTSERKLVHLPWFSDTRDEEARIDSEGEGEMALLHEEESRRLQEGVVQVDISSSSSKAKAKVNSVKKESKSTLIDEDDDIEEF